jgi:hypothetical protein
MSKQYYIVAQPKNGGSTPTYFVSSQTQGEKMIPFAFSWATRFFNRADVKAKIKQLAAEYKGLSFQYKIEQLLHIKDTYFVPDEIPYKFKESANVDVVNAFMKDCDEYERRRKEIH